MQYRGVLKVRFQTNNTSSKPLKKFSAKQAGLCLEAQISYGFPGRFQSKTKKLGPFSIYAKTSTIESVQV